RRGPLCPSGSTTRGSPSTVPRDISRAVFRPSCPDSSKRAEKMRSERRDSGEQKANMIRWPAVALRTCTVTFTGPSGIRHSVEVTAESIYEAAALGVSALKDDGWADVIAPGTEFEVQVARANHLSSAHGAADSSLVRWRRG